MVTVHYSLWAKCSQLWRLKSVTSWSVRDWVVQADQRIDSTCLPEVGGHKKGIHVGDLSTWQKTSQVETRPPLLCPRWLKKKWLKLLDPPDQYALLNHPCCRCPTCWLSIGYLLKLLSRPHWSSDSDQSQGYLWHHLEYRWKFEWRYSRLVHLSKFQLENNRFNTIPPITDGVKMDGHPILWATSASTTIQHWIPHRYSYICIIFAFYQPDLFVTIII